MLGISWQITLLALLLLPVFVCRRGGWARRLARLEREAANHNAAMSTQMTERFSAPGATLVKLFGRPPQESAEFAARATRVRDIGVRTAMVQWVFVTALTLVSALALALVYGLGGFYALQGHARRRRGRLAGAAADPAVRAADRAGQRPGRGDERAGQLRAGLRGARPEAADQGEARRRAAAGRAGRGRVRRRALRLPVGGQGVAGLAGGGRRRSTPAAASRCCTTSRSGPSRARWSRWSARPAPASRPSRSWCRACTTSTAARCGSPASTCGT